MPKAKEVAEPLLAAEVPPAIQAAEVKPARIATFWSAALRTVKLPSGEVVFKHNRVTLTDEKLIDELLPMCGDTHRIWHQK